MSRLFSRNRPQPFPPLAECTSREEWEGLVREAFARFAEEQRAESSSPRGQRRRARWWVKYWFKDIFKYARDAVIAWCKSGPLRVRPDPVHRFPPYEEFGPGMLAVWESKLLTDHARVMADIRRVHQREMAVFFAKTAVGRVRSCAGACVDAGRFRFK